MLKNLSISNFLLIDNLEIEFTSGLCVLTGETGSGKSILVDAIGLMVGMRGGAEYIQTGFEQCSISGEFELDLDDGTRHILVENGINILVPPFVESGDNIIVDTRTIEYVKKV